MRRRLVALLCAVATLWAVSAVPGAAMAAPGGNDVRRWAVRPAGKDGKPDARTHFTLQAEGGGTVSDAALVTNLSPVAVTFKVYGTDAFNAPNGDFNLLTAAEKPVDVGSWMVFPHPAVTVPAGKTALVPFKIQVPAQVTPGDHVGGLIVSTIAPGSGAQGQHVSVESRVAVRVYLRIPGNLQPLLAVTAVSARYQGVPNPFGRGHATITYTVTNQGNIRLSGTPTLTVTNAVGRKIATLTPDRLPEVLPHQSATFTAVADGIFPAGPLTTKVALVAHADPQQPVGQAIPAVAADGSFWALSWVLVGIVVALIAVIVLVLVWRRRSAAGRLKRSWRRLQTTPAGGAA